MPLTLADIAEPRARDGIRFRIRRACRKVCHSLLPRKMERVVKRGGLRYMLNGSEYVHKKLIRYGYWEHQQIVYFFNEAQKRGARVFLDVGANFGYYSLLAARLGIFDEIHALEPHPQTYQRLLWHIKANNFEGVITPHNIAASDAERAMKMQAVGKDSGGLSVFSGDSLNTSGAFDIYAKPLDAVFPFRGRNVCAKIDVEQHESKAIRGAENLLAHNDVFLQIEIWPWKASGFAEMAARGYSLIYYHGNDFYFAKGKAQ